ncbi:MAG: macro domain-containing protein [Fibrobacterota bacterium]|nr:MAG: macro domain-containing protein [Fibrobacterota bacterium]
MIRTTQGNILDAQAEALVNTVNCVGVMGRGIALQFKQAFPDNFKDYESACKRQEVQPGRMFIHPTGKLTHPRFIVNFPTKRHWRGQSRLEDIQTGLQDLIAKVRELGIQSIALPPLGSGLGGLPWSSVRPLIIDAFTALPEVELILFEPSSSLVDARPNHSTAAPKMTPGKASLVAMMRRYLDGFMDPEVCLLEVHKLMYFLQECGEPLRLDYRKAQYGPYATNLRHVLKVIEGHLVSGYKEGDDPETPLHLVPGATEDAQIFLEAHPDTRQRVERTAKLVEGFESPLGMELLATVHWVAVREGIRDSDSVVRAIHEWNTRKREKFTPNQIGIALRHLESHGWLPQAA